MASECSIGMSADPSASRIMSGRALAISGNVVVVLHAVDEVVWCCSGW